MARRDKDEMGALTDDERAALEEADAEEAGEIEAKEAEVDEAVDAAKKAITERDPETGKFVAKDKAKDGGDEFSGEPDKKAEAEAEPAKAAAEPEPEPEPETKPADWELANRPRKTVVPDWEAPEDVEAKLAEIGTKRDALAEKFDNGDITAKEYQADLVKLDDERLDIKLAVKQAEMAEDMRRGQWLNREVPAFLDANPAYRDNPTLHAMLDAQVRHLQVKAMDEGGDALDPAILVEAHKAISVAIQSLTGVEAPKPEPKPAEPKTYPKRPPPPPTLAKVPSADATETDGAFASLDRLADANPQAFEDAMAKLPEAERERYLTSH